MTGLCEEQPALDGGTEDPRGGRDDRGGQPSLLIEDPHQHQSRKPDLGCPPGTVPVVPASLCQAGQVSLDIGQKDRNPDVTEIFCKNA